MNIVKKARLRQIVYISLPLFLLLLGIGIITGWERWQGNPTITQQSTATAVAPPASNTPIDPAITTIPPTATPTPQPTVTPYIPPTFPPDTMIALLGPPQNSTFNAQGTVVFYWRWVLPLSDDQYFSVYAQTNEGEQLLGTVTEPNLGTSYRLTANLSDLPPTAVDWHIRLQTKESDQPLFISDSRSLNILP